MTAVRFVDAAGAVWYCALSRGFGVVTRCLSVRDVAGDPVTRPGKWLRDLDGLDADRLDEAYRRAEVEAAEVATMQMQAADSLGLLSEKRVS